MGCGTCLLMMKAAGREWVGMPHKTDDFTKPCHVSRAPGLAQRKDRLSTPQTRLCDWTHRFCVIHPAKLDQGGIGILLDGRDPADIPLAISPRRLNHPAGLNRHVRRREGIPF